jgi:glycerol uptake facilitator-like aquaporin
MLNCATTKTQVRAPFFDSASSTTSLSFFTLLISSSPFLLSFLVQFALLNCSAFQERNSFFGLAIGFTVLAAVTAVGGISGGAFNPAVGTGPIIVDGLLGSGHPKWKVTTNSFFSFLCIEDFSSV